MWKEGLVDLQACEIWSDLALPSQMVSGVADAVGESIVLLLYLLDQMICEGQLF